MTSRAIAEPPKSMRAKVASRLGRSDRSAFGLWFWEIDRVLLMLVFVLLSVGLIAVAAASPSAAERYSGGNVAIAPLHYFWRQLMWVAAGIPVMVGVSMMPTAAARRFALGGAVICFVLLVLVPVLGSETNGARRWIGSGFARLQPSEFLKPFFVVAIAWLLSLRGGDKPLPMIPITGVLTAVVGAFLMKQPDMGQTVVFFAMWLVLAMLAGLSWRWIGGLMGSGVGLVVLAYLFYPVARSRIDNFLYAQGDTYQVDSAYATLTGGGVFGTGPGGGEKKFHLPEAHTDYIFSVIGEEFGLIACLMVAALFLAIIVRVLIKLLDEEDPFLMLAAAGLTTQLGVQAMINMAVNLNLAPSKGMTLPFISYGGSSLIALSIGYGLLLAFTRRNPFLTRSPYVKAGRR